MKHDPHKSPDELELLRFEGSNGQYTIPLSWSINVLPCFDWMLPLFQNLSWTLLKAVHDLTFITSDAPVLVNVPGTEIDIFSPKTYVDKDIEVMFPLSPQICLLGHRHRVRGNLLISDKDEVKSINGEVASSAERCFYSGEYSAGLERLLRKHSSVRLKVTAPGLPSPKVTITRN